MIRFALEIIQSTIQNKVRNTELDSNHTGIELARFIAGRRKGKHVTKYTVLLVRSRFIVAKAFQQIGFSRLVPSRTYADLYGAVLKESDNKLHTSRSRNTEHTCEQFR